MSARKPKHVEVRTHRIAPDTVALKGTRIHFRDASGNVVVVSVCDLVSVTVREREEKARPRFVY
jgi:hypothetical protein